MPSEKEFKEFIEGMKGLLARRKKKPIWDAEKIAACLPKNPDPTCKLVMAAGIPTVCQHGSIGGCEAKPLIYTPELVLDLIEHARMRGIEEGRAMERSARDGAATMSWTYEGAPSSYTIKKP